MRIAFACCGLLVAVYAEPATAQGDFRHPHLRPPGKVAVALKRVQARPLQRTASAFSGPVLNPGASEVTPARSVPPWHWRVLRTAWTDADEKAYGEFVRRIGESKCRRVHECLADAQSNPLYSESNPPGMRFTSDCADLPYMLRAYFAWKNGLPFSYSAAVSPLGQSDDIRYTEGGNRVSQRRDLTGPVIDARRAIPRLVHAISSAHYRIAPAYTGTQLPDHYPVKVSPEGIKPGTIIYDPDGHLAVVYKVTREGRIHFIDAHPDNSLTRGVYGRSFRRDRPALGAGFKRWRPQTLVGAKELPDGSYQGGRIVLAVDKDLADWSDEQFFGTEPNPPHAWDKARFVHDGQALDYYEFVRLRLAEPNFKYDPLDETRFMLRTICADIGHRVDAVNVAVKARIHLRPQPARLPDNIYGTTGDWETYSTPSRDARLRSSFKDLRDEVARFLDMAATGSPRLNYTGHDIRRDLREVYLQETSACTFTYTRSNGAHKQLSLADLQRRLFRLSFDPHHCVERRWGADDAEEVASCADAADKADWYAAEQRLRNQIDRAYFVEMSFTLPDLRRKAPGSGLDAPPDTDVMALLGE